MIGRAIGVEWLHKVRLGAHAEWKPPAGRPDPVDILIAQGRHRLPKRPPERYARMKADPIGVSPRGGGGYGRRSGFGPDHRALAASAAAPWPTRTHVRGMHQCYRRIWALEGEFDKAIAHFAMAYAAQTTHDWHALLAAIEDGRISAAGA